MWHNRFSGCEETQGDWQIDGMAKRTAMAGDGGQLYGCVVGRLSEEKKTQLGVLGFSTQQHFMGHVGLA